MDEQKDQSPTSPRSLNLNNSILKLCLQMYGTLNPKGNQLFSPTGLHQLLSVLVTLCQQATNRRKLMEFLALPPDTESDELNLAWHEYLTTVRASTASPLKISFALFSVLDLDPTDQLGLIVKNMYGGEVITLKKGNPGNTIAHQVNGWVERATAGIIREIDINFDRPLLKSILTSIAYFKGKWSEYLKWESLPDVTFHVDDHTSLKTNFMHNESSLEYAADSKLQVQAVKLYYENRDYFLLILLPKNIDSLEKEIISSSDYLNSFDFHYKKVSIYLPRFLIRNQLDIMTMIRQICPDLDKFYTGSKYGLYVDDIKQINQLVVNEEGTEAASVTYSLQVDGPRPKPVLFRANKPFMYMLFHNDTVLFTGRLCNPLET